MEASMERFIGGAGVTGIFKGIDYRRRMINAVGRLQIEWGNVVL